VKWDMNRNLSDSFSPYLTADEQGAFNHRYVLGLYTVLETLVTKFPHILFESCASGGNRFDLGMLCYMPQIWASDNTDAISRLEIQEGYSYGYPTSVTSAHVSDCPNHQTLRQVPLETRFNVACFGLLGYECNLVDYSAAELKAIREQISRYKAWRKVFQFGDFYRLTQPTLKDGTSWIMVSKDKTKAVAGVFQRQVRANTPDLKVRVRGLDPKLNYRFYNQKLKHNVKRFGDLINVVSPVHIKNQSSLQHAVSLVYQLDGETEDHKVAGSLLMQAGISLKQGFAGVGYNQEVRLFQDYDSRLYYMEAVEGK
jgi:alpha-galactosidase